MFSDADTRWKLCSSNPRASNICNNTYFEQVYTKFCIYWEIHGNFIIVHYVLLKWTESKRLCRFRDSLLLIYRHPLRDNRITKRCNTLKRLSSSWVRRRRLSVSITIERRSSWKSRFQQKWRLMRQNRSCCAHWRRQWKRNSTALARIWRCWSSQLQSWNSQGVCYRGPLCPCDMLPVVVPFVEGIHNSTSTSIQYAIGKCGFLHFKRTRSTGICDNYIGVVVFTINRACLLTTWYLR